MSILIKSYLKFLLFFFALVPVSYGNGLDQPIESFYTVKAYGSPHFHRESLALEKESFLNLVNEVNKRTKDRAFLIEVPNPLYSDSVNKLRSAGFFHYHDFPENNSSVWCRTNQSGIPLAASHTLGARSIVYYKLNGECFFLLVKDRYKHDYEFPGGYVQPDDAVISEAFEKGIYATPNLDYRSPPEVAISEVYEETHFDLQKYGYGIGGTKKPLIIGQVYTKNTRPLLGIHSINDCCQFLLFEVSPNCDSLRKQDQEISDVRWVSYTDIIHNNVPGPLEVHTVTDNAKALVQRVYAMDKYKEARKELFEMNQKIKTLIDSKDVELTHLINLVQEQLNLLSQLREYERKLKQSNTYSNSSNVLTTYFVPL